MAVAGVDPPAVDLSELPPEAIAAGRLVGLLTGSGAGDLGIDTEWFAEPAARLEQVPHRLGSLAGLLGTVMTPAADPPAVFEGAKWYPLPSIFSGLPSAVHLVATAAPDPATPPSAWEFGAGFLSTLVLGPASARAFAYLPLVANDSSGTRLALGDPIQVGLQLVATDPTAPFETASAETFSGIEVDLSIDSSGSPSCKLTFLDLEGASDSTYTGLSQLLASNAATGRLDVAITEGAQPWLRTFPGNAPPLSGHRPYPFPSGVPAEDQVFPPTIGEILQHAGLLVALSDPSQTSPQGPSPSFAFDLEGIQGKEPEQIVLDLVHIGLDLLAGSEFPLVELPGGGIYVEKSAQGRYGVRATAKIALGGVAHPELDLCLGQWMSGEGKEDNWMKEAGVVAADPGLVVTMLGEEGGRPKFEPTFELNSVGFNLRGAAGSPLFELGGWSLAGVELRGSVSSEDLRWGVAARIDEVGMPLGGGFAASQPEPPQGNGVARSLVASGPAEPGGAPASPVNPAFSVEAAYMEKGHLVLELLDPAGSRAAAAWFPGQRRFGPVACNKLGIEVPEPGDGGHRLEVVVDGGISLDALEVELEGLSVTVPLTSLGQVSAYGLDLQGLTVTYASGAVEASGGLTKRTLGDGTVSYDGEALIVTEDLTLSALGSFGSLPDGSTSLFIFAWLDSPIGGPPFFYVTGLAAGFGYNRALLIPAQGQVQEFPLLAGVSNPSLLTGGTGGSAPPPSTPTPATVLSAIEAWAPPQRGEYWLAAGVQFTTFEIVNSNVLIIVEFGRELVIAVVGISTLRQPVEGPPWVSAELEVDVVCRPEQGTLLATAVLAPSSYVLTESAHLTGGFAFASWFGSNEHSGDFVLTIGGYHPAFEVPDHYPQEPRLGIDWQVSSGIAVVGTAYFAMTPAAMMAGAALQVTLEAGPLRAWLKASADVIVFWHPFFFDATVAIGIGVSFHIHIAFVSVTLSVEIGVDFELWGPPTGFKAHIDWCVISFDVGHGSKEPPQPLEWKDFEKLLPVATRVAPGEATAALAASAETAETTETTPAYVTISALSGLRRAAVAKGVSHWLMRGTEFVLAARSVFPPSSIELFEGPDPIEQSGIAIRPVGMETADYVAPQKLKVLFLPHQDPTEPGEKTPIDWQVTKLEQGVPQAIWGSPVAGDSPSPNSEAPTLPAIVGVSFSPQLDLPTAATPEMKIATVFAEQNVNEVTELLPIGPADQPVGVAPSVVSTSFEDIEGIETAAVAGRRDLLFAALSELGVDAWQNDPMEKMAASPGDSFADEPMEGSPA
jgi:hypothetical protein